MLARHAPRHLSAPIVADQVEALAVVARGRGDLEGVVHQLVEGVVGQLGRIGPRARRIAALVGRHGAIARRGERRQRRAPAVSRFGKAVQQQHERTAGRARNIRRECQARPGLYARAVHERPIRLTPLALNQASAFFQPSSAGSLR